MNANIRPYIAAGIIAHRPGEPFVYSGDGSTAKGLDWQAETDPPTWAEVTAWATELAAADASVTANEATIRDRADQAVATLENAWSNWGTLTPAQKDAALKLTVRVTVAIARLVLRKLDTGGV